MKILFICGFAEPGKDGVGDYTRRLCGELIRTGHNAQILSLCDFQVPLFSLEFQEIEGIKVVVNRIPAATKYSQRLVWSQDCINDFEPNWISLQYVPYSFNPKGLPFWLPSLIKKLKGNHKWHFMFHELWIGMDSHSTFKDKFVGLIQKELLTKLIKRRKQVAISTQAELYKSKMKALGTNVRLLPLFSNIATNRELLVEKNKNKLELKFCVFGGIHYGAPVSRFIEDLKTVLASLNSKRVLSFVFVGSCGSAIEEWKKVLENNEVSFEESGFVSDEEVSQIMSSCHYGISTTPYILNQKSGSLATLLDHHLPVLCVARNWTVNGYNQEPFLNLLNYEGKESINNFLNKKFIVSNENKLEFVALKFLDGLN